MKKITITIETVNAAFEPNPWPEIVRILHETLGDIDRGRLRMGLIDMHGNSCGKIKVK